MTAPRDPDRLIRAFLLEGEEQLHDQIYDAVRAEIDEKRQQAFIGPWRTPTMNRYLSIGLAAAAVVVIGLLLGSQLLDSPNIGGSGDATPTLQPSVAAATTTPEPSEAGGLPVGPHMILTGQADDPVDDVPPLTVTIPGPDWYGEVAGGILLKNNKHEPPDGSGMIIFVQPEYLVYDDACHWETTTPETVTTVEEFVAALSSQGSRTATEPVDITLGGYAAKSITLEVPDDVDFRGCDPGFGGSWSCGGADQAPCGYHSGASEIDTVYILDIDGLIMAWNTKYYAGTPAEDVAELEAIVQSASFGE